MKHILICILLLMVVSIPLYAQETPEDNECYDGGTMAGKCDTDWAWTCGWYLARFNQGIFTREQVPLTCHILLPPPAPSVPAASADIPLPSAGCILAIPPNGYVDFNGGFALPGFGVTTIYSDAACTIPGAVSGPGIVYSPPPFDPDELCQSALGMTLLSGPFANDVYLCS
jgi:hypothetical protein